MLHFELMTALVSYWRDHAASRLVIRKVYLRNLHRAIYTSGHILGNRVFAYYVVGVEDELVAVVRVVSNEASHVHCEFRVRLLLLNFDHLIIVDGSNFFHVLVVLQRLFDWWKVEHFVVRAHCVV